MATDTNPFPSASSSSSTATTFPETGSERVERGELNEGGVPPSGNARTEDMFSRVVQGAHQTIDRLADSAAPHVQRLSEGLDERTGQMREMSQEWTESLRSTVRENPLAAVATALAVGMLIARLTR